MALFCPKPYPSDIKRGTLEAGVKLPHSNLGRVQLVSIAESRCDGPRHLSKKPEGLLPGSEYDINSRERWKLGKTKRGNKKQMPFGIEINTSVLRI